MSEPNEDKSDRLLDELSDREQEAVVGGFGWEDFFGSFFFQKTDIDTFADAQDKFTDGSSISRRTSYKLSQITLAFTMPLFGGSGRRRSRSSSSRMRNIFNLFQSFWDN
ncbi:MAG: hypothetical protein CLLPBCKN_000764 [Chroococcidiopsis cubana SAG 39.79]|uniref:Uncharacterized protein n=1 Tax=Chroococcidiopsis cubana SAG 39.79 TaxID=388085 RepID=A0AB37UBR8_9CYAN|nr:MULTISPECIES: hypothetical protein [Chroococcidiopsis]PSB47409.1 hypothetical protein C7B80_09465 [Cyanosarcina cf. burmensis CCALA 770]MDZ4871376.1 hypothetical protein [Chroococcidiopsis cubana SAG 39.79]PSB56025.1 hypothetical protein C7B79_32710 [Chroococcidiopsis cubana CCALA 043]PSM50291.1 hypothetical protein C7Y66_04555 [Chroococcidiopsis sp. CCALA 051]RUT04917.1 hypothetical protein DSM107010_56630 [Chroococcidiopsis cubana SAG 39.79]